MLYTHVLFRGIAFKLSLAISALKSVALMFVDHFQWISAKASSTNLSVADLSMSSVLFVGVKKCHAVTASET